MKDMMNRVRRAAGKHALVRDERGLSTVEYVIILVLVAAAAIALWTSFGGILRAKIGDATDELNTIEVKEKDSK
jgi:Flp pilus assembly pilin Flp